MPYVLPIPLDTLFHSGASESVRIEYKASFSDQTLDQIIRTVCAYANDFNNLNGGYIVLGVEEKDGKPILPPKGLDFESTDEIQKAIRGHCNKIDPAFQPILSLEVFQEKSLLVIWVPPGDVRPYKAPIEATKQKSDRTFFVRLGSETVVAKGEILTQLIQLTARIPFDDRRNLAYTSDVISPALVRNFLSDIGSDLISAEAKISESEIYRNLRITMPLNGHTAPKNIALLFFTADPEIYFPGARIEIVEFGDDQGGNDIVEKVIRGPIPSQVREALQRLNSIQTTLIRKIPGQAEVRKTVSFPYEAMEEALVNAVYHRSYEGVQEPTKIYLYPDRMEIISYPGPVPGIELKHFEDGQTLPPVPNRNRRIGEFLKDLGIAEGRGTGIPKIIRKMNENGSPKPKFDFDAERTYFRVTLPAHPQFIVTHALRESFKLWTIGDKARALENLREAFAKAPTSGAILARIIEFSASMGDELKAESLFIQAQKSNHLNDPHLPYLAMAKIFLDRNEFDRAAELLLTLPQAKSIEDIIEIATLLKRSNRLQEAHKAFSESYDMLKDSPKAVHEFAQTKILLSISLRSNNVAIKKTLNREAIELLRRAIQLADDPIRSAWCHFDLATSLSWFGAPLAEIENAFERAIELSPNETRFIETYKKWKRSH